MNTKKITAVNAPAFVRHMETLATLSTEENPGIYAFSIYEELSKLEKRANLLTAQLCNGVNEKQEELIEKSLSKILTRVNKLLTVKTAFINRDPRGYSLKIKEREAKEIGIYQDWDGYGILAPEF